MRVHKQEYILNFCFAESSASFAHTTHSFLSSFIMMFSQHLQQNDYITSAAQDILESLTQMIELTNK